MSASAPHPAPVPEDAADLGAAIEQAEAEIARWERAVLDASTPEAEEAARERLTRAELLLDALLDSRDECGSCEGWPRGK